MPEDNLLTEEEMNNDEELAEDQMAQELYQEQRRERQRVAKAAAKEIVKEKLKKEAKKAVKKGATKLVSSAFASVVLPILSSPIFWIILGFIFLIVSLIYIITHPCEALNFIDLSFLQSLCEKVVPGI